VVESPKDDYVKEETVRRSWFDVNEKVSKKDMEKIDVSLVKGGEIDIER